MNKTVQNRGFNKSNQTTHKNERVNQQSKPAPKTQWKVQRTNQELQTNSMQNLKKAGSNRKVLCRRLVRSTRTKMWARLKTPVLENRILTLRKQPKRQPRWAPEVATLTNGHKKPIHTPSTQQIILQNPSEMWKTPCRNFKFPLSCKSRTPLPQQSSPTTKRGRPKAQLPNPHPEIQFPSSPHKAPHLST